MYLACFKKQLDVGALQKHNSCSAWQTARSWHAHTKRIVLKCNLCSPQHQLCIYSSTIVSQHTDIKLFAVSFPVAVLWCRNILRWPFIIFAVFRTSEWGEPRRALCIHTTQTACWWGRCCWLRFNCRKTLRNKFTFSSPLWVVSISTLTYFSTFLWPFAMALPATCISVDILQFTWVEVPPASNSHPHWSYPSCNVRLTIPNQHWKNTLLLWTSSIGCSYNSLKTIKSNNGAGPYQEDARQISVLWKAAQTALCLK